MVFPGGDNRQIGEGGFGCNMLSSAAGAGGIDVIKNTMTVSIKSDSRNTAGTKRPFRQTASLPNIKIEFE